MSFQPSTNVSAINAVVDVQFEVPLYPYEVVEPISLDDAKAYMKIDFTDDDAIISTLLTVARETLETYLGLSIIQKRCTAQLINECGGIELPYGPTPYDIDTTLITDSDGNQFDQTMIKIYGNQFKTIEWPNSSFIQVIYSTGYIDGTIPSPILQAILAQTFFLYENRGEKAGYSGGGIRGISYTASYVCDAAKQLCQRYRRPI